ncbi:MAG: PKD domain-containing protein [Bacteroidetes bacterium]|nr:PKD domain-containing protein [Bacteroidota bacterium]
MLRHLAKVIFCIIIFSASSLIARAVTADFSIINSSGCSPLVVSFVNLSSGATSYYWTFGTGMGSSTLTSPGTTYNTPGTYTVTLVAYGAGGQSSTKTATVTVRPNPTVNFNASPTSGCAPLAVTFTDASTLNAPGTGTYIWYAGSMLTGNPATYTYTTAGSFNVTLQVTNSYGCISSLTKTSYINVVSPPSASFTGSPLNGCGTTVSPTFNGSATGNGPFTYFWSYGDGPSSVGSGQTVSHTYTGTPPQCWSPKLIVSDVNGCKDSITRSSYVCIHNPSVSISGNSSVCVKDQFLVLTATGTPSGGSVDWDWGDFTPHDNVPVASHKYATTGTYTVTLTYNYAGCLTTATKTIIVNPKPNVDFTINPNNVCPGSALITFTPTTTTGITAFEWDFGDGTGTSPSTSPSHVYTGKCFYTPSLKVTNIYGCKDTVVKNNFVKIYDLEVEAKANNNDVDSGCSRLIRFTSGAYTHCPGPGRSNFPLPITSYDWDYGNSVHSTLANPTYTYPDTGVYRVILTVTGSNGCVAKDTITVKVGIKPKAAFFTVPPMWPDRYHVCLKTDVYFYDTLSGNPPNTVWRWKFFQNYNDPPRLTIADFGTGLKIISYKFNHPDTITIMKIASHHGCMDTLIKVDSIIVDSPKSVPVVVLSCDTPTKVKFRNGSLGATSWKWYFGDGDSSTLFEPTHQYPALGTYAYTLITWNSRSGCSDTVSYPINLGLRSMTLSANDTAVCKGDTVRFNATLSGRIPTLYKWYDNNTFFSDSFVNTSRVFFPTGFHKIKVVITDDWGCEDSIVRNPYIFVSWPTVADTAVPIEGCMPLNVTFTDKSTVPAGAFITNRKWAFSSASVTTPITISTSATTASQTFNLTGDYDIKLIVTDNVGCVDSLTKPGYVHVYKPTAVFIVSDTACLGGPVQFNNYSVNAVAYNWDFGDFTPVGTTASPTHTYNTLGSFDVRLIVTDAHGCKDTSKVSPAVTTVKPTADFSMSDSVAVCPPLYVKFTNLSTKAFSYNWNFGTGTNSTFKSPNELFVTPGYYNVVLVASDVRGCKDSIIKHVNILGYTGAFSYSPLIGCKPLTVNFNSITTNVASFVWDFSDGTVVTGTAGSMTHTYTNPGTYVPKVIFSDVKGCKALSPGSDTIKVDAVEPDFLGEAPCQYSTVTLLDTSKTYFSPKILWRWTFHDGTTSNLRTPSHYYGAPGNYSVKLYVENSRGCKDSITKDLVIYPLPNISAGADTIICLLDSAQLHATGGVSYLWNSNPFLSCLSCSDPTAFSNVKTDFIVTGTDIHNCKNTDTVTVGIKTKVTAITSPDREMCDKDTLQLYVYGGKKYVWFPSDGLDNPGSAYPIASPHTTNKYMVVSYEGRCIPDTDFVKITVYPLPEVTATGENTIIAGNTTRIQATGKLIDKFKWSPAESLSCSDCPDPDAKPFKTTEYTIKVYTTHGCVDSDKVTIKVLCDNSQIFIPNTFTPNGDGENDVFYPRGTGLDKVRSFRVFNRWGEKVYERTGFALNNKTEGWDGTFNGATLPPDVFVYVLEAVCESGEILTIKGDITLVR